MLMQISHNDFDGKDYIQVIASGCVILEVPLVKEQENEKDNSNIIGDAYDVYTCRV